MTLFNKLTTSILGALLLFNFNFKFRIRKNLGSLLVMSRRISLLRFLTTSLLLLLTGLTYGQSVEVLNPTDDAYLQRNSFTSTNEVRYNDETLRVEKSGNRVRDSYLKFDLSGINGTITKLEFELTVYTDPGNGNLYIYKGAHNNWTEGDLSNSNKPASSSDPSASVGSSSGAHWDGLVLNHTLNTNILTGDFLTLVIKHTGSSDIAFASKGPETASIFNLAPQSKWPKLKVTYTPQSTGDTQAPEVPVVALYYTGTTAATFAANNLVDNVGVTQFDVFVDGVFSETMTSSSAPDIYGLSPNTTYTIAFKSVDAAGNKSALSQPVTFTTKSEPDTEAPEAPQLTLYSTDATNAYLSAQNLTDNVGVTQFEIFIDGVFSETINADNAPVVSNLLPGTTYTIAFKSVDDAGNKSVLSQSLSVTTDGGIDTEAPFPGFLQVLAQPGSDTSLGLSIVGFGDNVDVTQFEIYMDNELRETIDVPSFSIAQVVNGLQPGTSYSFYVIALDAAGNRSVPTTTEQGTTSGTPIVGGSDRYWIKPSGSDNIHYTVGNVGIGRTGNSSWALDILGKMRGNEIKVEASGADYVFVKEYQLPTLAEVEKHIKENGYLINVPSAKEVQANGIELGQWNMKLLEKIEELTLYIIDQKKRINALEQKE